MRIKSMLTIIRVDLTPEEAKAFEEEEVIPVSIMNELYQAGLDVMPVRPRSGMAIRELLEVLARVIADFEQPSEQRELAEWARQELFEAWASPVERTRIAKKKEHGQHAQIKYDDRTLQTVTHFEDKVVTSCSWAA